MAKKKPARSRSEITERVDRNAEGMREKREELDITVTDVETARGTMEGLDLAGTTEGMDAVQEAIDQAEEAGKDVFEQQDSELESLHDVGEEFEDEVRDQGEMVRSDGERITAAAEQVETSAVKAELQRAEQAGREDEEFLKTQEQRATTARGESERIQEQYRARAHGR